MKVTRPEDIGALIRGYRLDNDLSQSELAERLQTTQKWLSHIENGKPTAHIGLILRALNELGFAINITIDNSAQPQKGRRRPRFSIDDVVDG